MDWAMMILGAVVTTLGLVFALITMYRGSRVRVLWKGIASTGFLVVALAAGAFETWYGILVLAALVFCWCGDIALTSTQRGPFLVGLVTFFIAHALLIAAFWMHGVALGWCIVALLVVIPAGAVVLWWLYPHIPAEMRVPVIAYMIIISAMVVLAFGAKGREGTLLIALGAATFYVSDVFVARNQFVSPGIGNAIVGYPIYYGAVTMFAFSIAMQ